MPQLIRALPAVTFVLLCACGGTTADAPFVERGDSTMMRFAATPLAPSR